jgi:DNA polymerase-3 subunit epsilon
MAGLFFYDTETTGLPDFSQPSEAPHQPHMVQLAAALVDPGSRKIVASIDLIIKPDGWEIPKEVAEIHGITTETAQSLGVDEEQALTLFMGMWLRCDSRIAHNEDFDARIIRIALKRYGWGDEAADEFKAGKSECTCEMSKPICKLPATDRMRAAGFGKTYKKPKLIEAYQHIIGKPMENAHNAMADVRACIEIYWAMKDEAAARAATA